MHVYIIMQVSELVCQKVNSATGHMQLYIGRHTLLEVSTKGSPDHPGSPASDFHTDSQLTTLAQVLQEEQVH